MTTYGDRVLSGYMTKCSERRQTTSFNRTSTKWPAASRLLTLYLGNNGLENRWGYNTQDSLRFSAVYRQFVTIRMRGGLLQARCCQRISWRQTINFKSSFPRFHLIRCNCLRIHVNLDRSICSSIHANVLSSIYY